MEFTVTNFYSAVYLSGTIEISHGHIARCVNIGRIAFPKIYRAGTNNKSLSVSRKLPDTLSYSYTRVLKRKSLRVSFS